MAPKHNGSVPTPDLSSTQKIKFSFEYYDTASTKYCMSCWNQAQVRGALMRLQNICTKSFNDLNRERKVYHFGEVDWSQTIEKDGFPDSRVNCLPPFHFALLGVNSQLTRVYGAYSSGTFYVVWFDLNHEIWPTPLRHT